MIEQYSHCQAGARITLLKVVAYDPVAIPTVKEIFHGQISYTESPIECLKEADCCIIVTEWPEFKKLTPKDFINQMKNPILIDGRRIYDPEKFNKKLNFVAIGLG